MNTEKVKHSCDGGTGAEVYTRARTRSEGSNSYERKALIRNDGVTRKCRGNYPRGKAENRHNEGELINVFDFCK